MTPPGTPQGAFLNCKVNGFECHALLDTGAEATIISEVVYNHAKSSLCKLQSQHKPVLGANNMPLDVLGEVEITLQLGGVTAQHRVFVCRGLAQEILVDIDFLRTHKCVLNFDTGTVYTKEGPSKMVFGHLDKVCRITVAKTITLSPNMVANIPCQVQEAVGLDELEGVLQPSEKFTERYAAGAFRTAVTIKERRVPVRVFNPLNKPLKIYKSSSIGELYPLHGGEELSEEDNVGINYKIVSPGVPESDVGVLQYLKLNSVVQCSWKNLKIVVCQ